MKERYPDPDEEEDISILDNRSDCWRYIFAENNLGRSKIHSLRWDVHMKDKW